MKASAVAATCAKSEQAAAVGDLIGTAYTARDIIQIVDAVEPDGMLRYWGKFVMQDSHGSYELMRHLIFYINYRRETRTNIISRVVIRLNSGRDACCHVP